MAAWVVAAEGVVVRMVGMRWPTAGFVWEVRSGWWGAGRVVGCWSGWVAGRLSGWVEGRMLGGSWWCELGGSCGNVRMGVLR